MVELRGASKTCAAFGCLSSVKVSCFNFWCLVFGIGTYYECNFGALFYPGLMLPSAAGRPRR